MPAAGGHSAPAWAHTRAPGRQYLPRPPRRGEADGAAAVVRSLALERVSGAAQSLEQLGYPGGQSEVVVAGLHDRGELAVDVQGVAGAAVLGGALDHGLGGRDEQSLGVLEGPRRRR